MRRGSAALLGVLFLTGLLSAVIRPATAPPAATSVGPGPGFGTAEMVGRVLFTRFLLPFELASIILLVGIIAAVVLAKGTLPVRVPAPQQAEGGSEQRGTESARRRP
ncbi:MAG: NADH-quinone oxidoreductase subunit J [Armatimonadetes bacterium]|nr:NADH-quinone oxidoreductase subunit J [Armatimonadota bacterium]